MASKYFFRLAAAAGSSLSNFKEMSAIGLQYAIERHNVVDMKINIEGPYIIIPYGGKYTGTENVIVANLGDLRINSVEREGTKVKDMAAGGVEEKQILQRMVAESYEQFLLEFTDLQVNIT